ncbi:conserved exported hypothetical protein [Tenacibaculum maritimum]|uniref:hypothetical protein n=1 Tax=Tenacibaculum maritimum TaxID=107401 RepID=UPI0012E6821C|nr:hypothetical protein [Tenacibaculum maritimum]CAA0144119.1 conserved exported hypothetical protein [Tenacibaculum maritimum]
MRIGILLLFSMITLATTNAKEIKKSTTNTKINNRYNDVVTFIERGVQFHVFLNGDFDFNTHFRDTKYVDYRGRRTRAKSNHGVRIERDYRGRVRRVGNTFINYDLRGNVKRIGTVYINYRFGQLSQVGNLRIQYDRWGNPLFYGTVKYSRYNDDYCNDNFTLDDNLGDVCDYDDIYFYKKGFRNNYRKFKEDNNFYYYKAKPNASIGKRNRILKRRKPNNNLYYKK